MATARPTLLLALATSVLGAACSSDRNLRQAGEVTVRLHTDPGSSRDVRAPGGELGVSTEYGVVFLGRGQRSGEVSFTIWFPDGPSPETGIVEPLGAGLYVAYPEVRVPTVPLTFDEPPAGTEVLVGGRGRNEAWLVDAVVGHDERVEGLLLRERDELRRLDGAATGAGVYVEDERGRLSLLGLVSGRLELDGRRFLTVVGPRDLWRLVSHPHDAGRERPTSPRAEIGP